MWKRWSAPVLKVIWACLASAGIHYLHSCSPKAQGTTGRVDEKSASQSWSNTYLYCMAHWVRSAQCQDYHSLPGNFIIVCTSGCVTMQVALPFKSKARQHRRLHRAIFGKTTVITKVKELPPPPSKFNHIALAINRFTSRSPIEGYRLIWFHRLYFEANIC